MTHTYDGNGNLVEKVETVPGREPVRHGYEYDPEDRLVRVSVDGSEQATYAYAADGTRINRTEAGETTYFLQDARDANGFNDVLGELNATGVMKGRYVHGPGIDEPLAKFDTSEVPQGQWYYVHADGRGSVTKVTRPDKSVANRYDYDDFGNFRSKTEAIPNPYGFTGRETDVPGLVYYRARYYDSEAGRFLTRDPAGTAGGANRYAYAGNNPVSAADPSGMATCASKPQLVPAKGVPWLVGAGGTYKYFLLTSGELNVLGPYLGEQTGTCEFCQIVAYTLCEIYLEYGIADVIAACAEGCAFSALTVFGFGICTTICIALAVYLSHTICEAGALAICKVAGLC